MVGQIRQGSEALEVPARNQPHPRRPSRISSLDKGQLGVAVGAPPPAAVASAAHGKRLSHLSQTRRSITSPR